MSARFRQRQRLRTRAEFDRVFRGGARLEGALFALLAAPNGRDVDRLGLVVSRRVGNAVARNRARRLLRESFRRLRRDSPRLDIVVLVKAGLTALGQADVDHELDRRLAELARRTRPRGARPHPAH